MKYTKLFIILAVVCATFCSCSKKKLPHEPFQNEFIRPASMVYTAEDTTSINSLADKYVNCLKQRDFQSAVNMLYTFNNDSIKPLTDSQKKSYLGFFENVPVYDVAISSFILRSDRDNEVKLTMQIVRSGSIKEERGVTHVSINPVKKGDKWYLTLLDNASLKVSEFE